MKIKTLFFAMLAGLFVLSFSVAVAAKETADNTFKNIMFGDVKNDHKNFDAIYFLYNTDVIQGYEGQEAREYKPDNKINRAEFLKLIMEGMDKADHAEYEQCFPDVVLTEWYATYICQAKKEGIVNGYPDGKFKPDQPITEVEALKILGELEDWKLTKNANEEWYMPYLNFADKREIVPVEDKIDAIMTRGDIAEMIFRNTQVEELKIDKFEEKLVDELFYNFEIPFGGPMGPGGIFGPGGLFGETGAFDDSAYFAGKEGQFEMLDEDFYKDRYCYYSDKGDFMDQVEDILNFISDGKMEDIELSGYDVDGFGVMFCYNGIAATDLQLFTKELRDEYNVQCWFDPMFSMSAQGGFERILCYSEPEKPQWLSEDSYCKEEIDEKGYLCTTCYKDVFSESVLSTQCNELVKGPAVEPKDLSTGKDLYIEFHNESAINAGEDANLEFFLTDNDGAPIKNRNLKLVASTGIDYAESFEVKEMGMGVYKASFAPKLAGLYILTAIDEASGTKNDVTLRVNALSVDHIQVVDTIEPNESLAPNMASVKVVSKDKYENTVPYSKEENNLLAITTMGSLIGSHEDDGIFTFELYANDWGTSELSFLFDENVIGEKIKFDFFPIQIGMPKGISVDDDYVEAPVYIYFPSKYGKIGSYDFKIKHNSNALKFSNFVDFNEKDAVTMPLFDVQNDFIRVWQPSTEVDSENQEILTIGTLLFDVTSVGDGTINVADAVLKDTYGKEKAYSTKFINDASGEISGFSGGLWGGTHVVKPTKNICIEAFVLPFPPGTGGAPLVTVTPAATEAEIESDVNQTNEIFKAIARSCNCNFYLNVTLRKPVKILSFAEVDAFDANHNNAVDSDGDYGDANLDDVDRMRINHPPTDPKCIPVYYTTSVIAEGARRVLGLSQNGTRNGVVMDNSLDNDGRTLAHELAHQLSGGHVHDPTHANAHAEGADQAGNLMNYNNTGDILLPQQCAEIEGRLP